MNNLRVLNQQTLDSMLDYLGDVTDEVTATIFLSSVRGHISELTNALEFIAGEAGWLDEATERASDVLSRINPPDGKTYLYRKGELVGTSDE